MIQANELRIGNWVSGRNDPDMKVVSIDENSVQLRFDGVDSDYGDWYYEIEELQPIPLTPEILESAGFKESDRCIYGNGRIAVYFADGEAIYNTTKIQYLHELQNLNFAISKEELTINLHATV